MAKIQKLEFLGGPWDGALVLVEASQTTVGITDGARLHLYERGECWEGPRVREVMRHVRICPLPQKK